MTELIFSDMPNFLKGFLGTFLVYLATSNLEESISATTLLLKILKKNIL